MVAECIVALTYSILPPCLPHRNLLTNAKVGEHETRPCAGALFEAHVLREYIVVDDHGPVGIPMLRPISHFRNAVLDVAQRVGHLVEHAPHKIFTEATSLTGVFFHQIVQRAEIAHLHVDTRTGSVASIRHKSMDIFDNVGVVETAQDAGLIMKYASDNILRFEPLFNADVIALLVFDLEDTSVKAALGNAELLDDYEALREGPFGYSWAWRRHRCFDTGVGAAICKKVCSLV